MMTWSNGNISRVTGPLCGYSPLTGEFPAQRPMARGFDVLFDLRLNKRLSKQAKRRWFYTPSRSYDVTAMISRYKIQNPYLGFHIDEVPTDFVYSWARRYKVWTAICIPDIGQNFIEVHDTGQICRNGVDSRHKQTIGMASVVWKCERKWKGDGYDLSSIVTFCELWLNHLTLWCFGMTRKHFTKIWYRIHYHIVFVSLMFFHTSKTKIASRYYSSWQCCIENRLDKIFSTYLQL